MSLPSEQSMRALLLCLLCFGWGGSAHANFSTIEAAIKQAVVKELSKKSAATSSAVITIGVNANDELCSGAAVLASYQSDTRLRLTGEHVFSIQCANKKLDNIQATVVIERRQLVAVEVINRGELLTAINTREVLVDWSKAIGRKANLLGQVAKRRIREGQVITSSLVEVPKMIMRGQRITLIADGGTILATIDAEAMTAGAKGEIIKVRNLSSKKVLEAIVESENTAFIHVN